MAESLRHATDTLIVPIGTQVVLRPVPSATDIYAPGSVAVIVRTPGDAQHAYRLRFLDGQEASVKRREFALLKHMNSGPLARVGGHESSILPAEVIYRCVVGSRAYGLSHEASDIDRRGIYLPSADQEWSLYGVPEQLENRETDECYWELKKFLILALKANPNILECLFTPVVEYSSETADALIAERHIFLSKLVYQTYNGYVLSQFKKLEQDLRATGEVRYKHAMHLIRLLLQGIRVLQEGFVEVRVEENRDALLAIRHGERGWAEIDEWRLRLHREFDRAYQGTTLPETPDYAAANRLLLLARRRRAEERL